MRLCTRAEMNSGMCCGTGCGFNSHQTWIDGECGSDTPDFRPVCKTNADCESGSCDVFGPNVNGDPDYHYCNEPTSCDPFAPSRVDGICNNLNAGRRLQGSTGHLQLRRVNSNGINAAQSSGGNSPVSPRAISDALGDSEGDIPNNFGGSSLLVYFGQFIDHDITIIHMDSSDTTTIQGSGEVPNINFERSKRIGASGNPPYHENDITAYLDLTQVYGSDQATASALRTHTGGALISQYIDGVEYLPTVAQLPGVGMAMGHLPGMFAAGDIRANEHMVLASLHTLFLREHNRLAKKYAEEDPTLSDEEVYQLARKWNIAQYQNIVFNEFLPGWYREFLPVYTGYDDEETPDIDILFSTASFRFGHSCIQNQVRRSGRNGQDFSVNLGDVFFRPHLVTSNGGIDSVLKGQTQQCHEMWDTRLVDGLRNMLFEDIPGTNGSVAMDLLSLNIQRGRDHDLPSYTDARAYFGLPVPQSFQEVTGGVNCITNLLEQVYGVDNVEACDPIICGFAERATRGQQGELFFAQNMNQFRRLRDADRFYFENRHPQGPRFTLAEISLIRDTYMHDILRRNTFMNGDSEDTENFVVNAFESDECCRRGGNFGLDTICVNNGAGTLQRQRTLHCPALSAIATGNAFFAGSTGIDCQCQTI